MAHSELNDLRAIETILAAVKPLDQKDQVRVLCWVIEKLDLVLDIRLAMKETRPGYRGYIDMAWERVPHLMSSPSDFLAAASPRSMADRVLVMATFLQLKSDHPGRAIVTGREINAALARMRMSVGNITDCVYTLMKRTPPHMVGTGPVSGRKRWNGYQVTEAGIHHVYERIVEESVK